MHNRKLRDGLRTNEEYRSRAAVKLIAWIHADFHIYDPCIGSRLSESLSVLPQSVKRLYEKRSMRSFVTSARSASPAPQEPEEKTAGVAWGGRAGWVGEKVRRSSFLAEEAGIATTRNRDR